jgi:hypothetical protein
MDWAGLGWLLISGFDQGSGGLGWVVGRLVAERICLCTYTLVERWIFGHMGHHPSPFHRVTHHPPNQHHTYPPKPTNHPPNTTHSKTNKQTNKPTNPKNHKIRWAPRTSSLGDPRSRTRPSISSRTSPPPPPTRFVGVVRHLDRPTAVCLFGWLFVCLFVCLGWAVGLLLCAVLFFVLMVVVAAVVVFCFCRLGRALYHPPATTNTEPIKPSSSNISTGAAHGEATGVCMYYLSIYLSFCLSVCLSFYLSACLSFFLSFFLSICLSVCSSVCLSAYLFIHLSI